MPKLPSKLRVELVRDVELLLMAGFNHPAEAVRFLLEQFSGWDLDAIKVHLTEKPMDPDKDEFIQLLLSGKSYNEVGLVLNMPRTSVLRKVTRVIAEMTARGRHEEVDKILRAAKERDGNKD